MLKGFENHEENSVDLDGNAFEFFISKQQLIQKCRQNTVDKSDTIPRQELWTSDMCTILCLTTFTFYYVLHTCLFCSQTCCHKKAIFSELILYLAPLITKNAPESGIYFFENIFPILPAYSDPPSVILIFGMTFPVPATPPPPPPHLICHSKVNAKLVES